MRLMMALIPVLILASPAGAQIAPRDGPPGEPVPSVFGPQRPAPTIRDETDEARERIDRGRSSGAFSRREARRLRRQAQHIDDLASRYGSDGLSDSERRELETRARVLQSTTDAERMRKAGGRR